MENGTTPKRSNLRWYILAGVVVLVVLFIIIVSVVFGITGDAQPNVPPITPVQYTYTFDNSDHVVH